jgi:DNA-directed RNA polymerase specialized sigma24 family protein/CheY-like chemotaxis protein
LSEQIRQYLPLLRRYARALCGSQSHGDAIVRMTLEAIIAAPNEFSSPHGVRVSLYRYFHLIWGSATLPDIDIDAEQDPFMRDAHRRLAMATSPGRQVLLLNALEGFTLSETAVIMNCERREVEQWLHETIADVDRESRTSVLIIEDEPLIAMELERIVTSLGHHVSDVATTYDDAVHAFAHSDASLVLADVQLADGSSGIDAVQEILTIAPVPIIFITAYPEQLLTGSRTEPSFLIAKPFHENSVRAAISQSLYFDTQLVA